MEPNSSMTIVFIRRQVLFYCAHLNTFITQCFQPKVQSNHPNQFFSCILWCTNDWTANVRRPEEERLRLCFQKLHDTFTIRTNRRKVFGRCLAWYSAKQFLQVNYIGFVISNCYLNKCQNFREAALRMSREFKDRPLSATDTAVFWIEYVIRNGNNALKSVATELYWWQLMLMDVYTFFLVCVIVILWVIKCVVMRILRKIQSAETKIEKNVKKEKWTRFFELCKICKWEEN